MDPSAPKPHAENARKDRWYPGERCLAPSPDNEKLCEASIKSITVDEHGKPFAVVLYSDFQERKIPLKRLQEVKPPKEFPRNFIFDDEDLEKPYFPHRKFPSSADAFKLSENGDSIPYTINRYLRDYQREGAQFLYGHYIQGRGCILGDDMGLGKTVQMFLIVAPLSVLYNWKDELETWGYFKVIILHGNKKDNGLIRLKQRKCEIVLTTYETLRLCLHELNSLEWSAVIVDEAHRIKNPKARVTEVMRALKCSVRIGLTGTILQNNMKELWCVMDWAVPGLLGSRSYFKKQFSDPVEHGQRHTATKRELATGRKAMRRLAEKMSGWFLRRTKTLIKDQLPKKEDRMVYCSLTEFQKAVYQTVLDTEDVTVVLESSQPCTCGSGRKRRSCCHKTNSYGETVKSLCLSYLTVLRKIANHVALLQVAGTSKNQETLTKRICDQVFSRFPDFVQKSKDAAFETLSDPKYSGKMKVLQQLLNHFRTTRDKVLLFSFSTKLLDVLQQYCMASGLDYRRLDGSTKSEDRLKIVKEFNNTQDVNICLVSTMAGGLGLNFVGANVVILFDPTWNPANDLQAIDRVYRIGQCRDVKVLRLISLGTVEEVMYLRQLYKQQLHCAVVGSENAKRYFEAVQGSKEHRGELFGIHNLFKLRSQGSCLTRDILEREGQVEAGIMTATTWLKGGPPAQKVKTHREPGYPEPEGQEGPAEPVAREVCDLSSDFSDDESMENSEIKTTKSKAPDSRKAPGSSGQLTLLHCGFSKLFEAKCPAVEDSVGTSASDDESSDEQPTCLVAEAQHAGCQETQNSVYTSEHLKLDNILNPSEKCVFDKSEVLEQNVSSESDDETDFDAAGQYHGSQSDPESGESNVICPTQYTAQKLPNQCIRFRPPVGRSEKSEGETPIILRYSGDNGQTRDKHSSSKKTLKSFMKRKDLDDVSDESDDIDISPKSRVRKQSAPTSLRFKRKQENKQEQCDSCEVEKANRPRAEEGCSSQCIDDSWSSDDSLTVSHLTFSKHSLRAKTVKGKINFSPKLLSCEKKTSAFLPRKPVSFSNERAVSQEQIYDSMDKILDGVQEVAYIHSNQNVIGSSKAENHMSRWATRDVFELKQFSQLPANIAVCTPKTFKKKVNANAVKPAEREQLPPEGSLPSPLCVPHPVQQKKKAVFRTSQTTFIVGETPKGVRRKQFEEMASYYNLSSAKEFAKQVVDAPSEERQGMLKDFYVSQYPELKELFEDFTSEFIKSAHKEGEKVRNTSENKECRMKKRLPNSKTLSLNDSTNKNSQICSPKVHKGKSVKHQNHSFRGDEVLSGDTETNTSPVSSPGEIVSGKNSRIPTGTVAPDSLTGKSEAQERKLENSMEDQQALTSTGILRNTPLFKLENKKLENPALKTASVEGLLGDTSILDDLFKSHRNSPTQLPKRVLSEPVAKAKQRPKDFWDILNEQSDDNLSKFTDLATIETLCERAPSTASSRSKEELETSLWKSNDKFLWKPFDWDHTDDSTASGEEHRSHQ
uniref:DNA excision repair protein ERCC-6-like 2 isoform X1 n=1 Tax=Jaculus jaculus TaxID=51337 RepID=UPI001E1B4ECC|nr:DNA excision repair protein ERCC-6-like 2 isoform X1 [Jaculus jaculus]